MLKLLHKVRWTFIVCVFLYEKERYLMHDSMFIYFKVTFDSAIFRVLRVDPLVVGERSLLVLC